MQAALHSRLRLRFSRHRSGTGMSTGQRQAGIGHSSCYSGLVGLEVVEGGCLRSSRTSIPVVLQALLLLFSPLLLAYEWSWRLSDPRRDNSESLRDGYAHYAGEICTMVIMECEVDVEIHGPTTTCLSKMAVA